MSDLKNQFINTARTVEIGNPSWQLAQNSGLTDLSVRHVERSRMVDQNGHAFMNMCSCSYLGLEIASIFYGIGFGAYAFFEHTALVLSFVVFWTMGEILGITHITALISQKTSLQAQASLFSLIPILLAVARMVSVGLGASLISGVGFAWSWSFYGLFGLALGGACLLSLGRGGATSRVPS